MLDFVNHTLALKQQEFPKNSFLFLLSYIFQMSRAHISLAFATTLSQLSRLKLDLSECYLVFQNIQDLQDQIVRQDYSHPEDFTYIIQRYQNAQQAKDLVTSIQSFLSKYVLFWEEIAENSDHLSKSYQDGKALGRKLTEIKNRLISCVDVAHDNNIISIFCDFMNEIQMWPGSIRERVLELMRRNKHHLAKITTFDFDLSNQSLIIVFSVNQESLGQIRFASHAATLMLKYSVEALCTMKINDLMPHTIASRHNKIVSDYLQHNVARRRQFTKTLVFPLDNDNSLVPMFLQGKVLPWFYSEYRMVGSLALASLNRFRAVVMYNQKNQIIALNEEAQKYIYFNRRLFSKSEKQSNTTIDQMIPALKTRQQLRGQIYSDVVFKKSLTLEKEMSLEGDEKGFCDVNRRIPVEYCIHPEYSTIKDVNYLFLSERNSSKFGRNSFDLFAHSNATSYGQPDAARPGSERPSALLSEDE